MDEITKIRKQNMKIYALYRAISCDLIFYYAIEFLFLIQVKNISSADIVLGTSFYSIFMIFLQIPASIFIDKIGTKRCMILANILNSIFVILIMRSQNLGDLILAQFVSSLCFSLKDISDIALIQYSIPKTKKKGEIFSKLEGKGSQYYYFINAITAVSSGFLYVINPYIPMIASLCFTLLSIFLSLGFQEIQEEKEIPSTKQYLQDFTQGVKFIAKSQRLRSLFIYAGISWGIFSLMGTYRSSQLVDIGTPEQIITIIAALAGICASFGSKRQLQFHNHFRNKTLSTILWILTGGILVAGIAGIIHLPFMILLILIPICYMVIDFLKGMSLVLVTRYTNNFAKNNILTQIYASSAIIKNIFRAIIGFLGSYLLRITNTANAMILIGILLMVVTIGLTSYMKTRLGLKPEQYDETDIFKEGRKS